MNSIAQSNALAKQICAGGYRYLYGGKDQNYTSALVNSLAKLYPKTFTPYIKAEALKDADKGYKAIDCSGFTCKVLGIGNIGSSQLNSTAYKRYAVKKENAREGMLLWKSGHIAYVGEGLKIYEAKSTVADMCVSTWENRAGAFTYLIVARGSALESEMKSGATTVATNPYAEPTKVVTSKAQAKLKGETNYISSGNGVKWVQWHLKRKGYDIGKWGIDGDCGSATVSAIIKAQKDGGLVQDGLCGSKTRGFLKK